MPRSRPLLFPEIRVGHRPTMSIENRYRSQGFDLIAGVDEGGAGPLAGPVVAAAVVLPASIPSRSRLYKVRDSKLLRPDQRAALYHVIVAEALDVAWAMCPPEVIDRINIYHARFEAMSQAVMSLSPEPRLCLVDGNRGLPCRVPSVAIVKGDRQCLSIAAASVLAKVIRDSIMEQLGRLYPAYGFAAHKGYATAEHIKAVLEHGPCPIHRRSFQIIRECLEGQDVSVVELPDPELFD